MLFVCLLQCQPGEQSNRPTKRSFAMAIASSPTRRRRHAFGDNTSSQTDAPRERKPKANNSYITSSIHKPKQKQNNKTNIKACRVCSRCCNSEDPVNKRKKLRWDYMRQIRLCLLSHLEIVSGKQCHHCTKVLFLLL